MELKLLLSEIVSEVGIAMAIQVSMYVKSGFSRRELVVTTLGQDIETSCRKIKKSFPILPKIQQFPISP